MSHLLLKLVNKTLALVGLVSLLSVSTFQIAGASTVVGFIPGNIIDDATFTNTSTMDANQIQAFLSSKVPSCDTNGVQNLDAGFSAAGVPDYNGNGSIQRWEWGKYHYNQVTFPCLRDYIDNGHSAAQIIRSAAVQYNINPEVLIVLLQKEQGLVTDTWPLSTQYKTATGYACPDSGTCDSLYYGLTNQVDNAANMYHQIMIANPSWITPYVVGSNSVKWNPNTSCGSSSVFIENRATQALYNYTPYRPNQAALNAGYSNGDSCSSYGNRNFYLYFSDWFGPTHEGSLVRSTTSAQVYIVSGDNKYPVNAMAVLNVFSKLGPLWYATDSYINSLTTGPAASPLIKEDSGSTLYFVNASIKLPFTNCTVASDYATPCGSEITLSPTQMSKFVTGPNMTNFYQTTTGYSYYIVEGKKREVFDNQSAITAGLTPVYNRLLDSGISGLPDDIPVIRDNVVVTNRTTGKNYLYQSGKVTYLPSDILSLRAFSTLPRQPLNDSSISIETDNGTVSGFIQDSSSNKYILDANGKTQLTNPAEWSSTYTTLDDAFISTIPNSSQPTNSQFVKGGSSKTIYYVTGVKKYSISSWGDFIKLHSDKSTKLSTVSGTTMNTIQSGSNIYAPGSLIKSSNSASVYVVDGVLHKIALGSFAVSSDLGLSGVRTVSVNDLSSYTNDSGVINNLVSCGGKKYLANNGKLYEVDSTAETMYGYSQSAGSTWDSLGCTNLSIAPNALSTYSFIKSSGSKTIYYVDSGEKHTVGSMARYTTLGGGSSNLLIVSGNVLNTIPVGPTA
ncbi:MAG: hypothetical protein H6797_00105 [Candidatus Nomurabacteria bacterium]|nr:MAG: hypothetical protein H6797_00105 [Candidatus Nomurabacteria bacterium]